MSDLDSWKKPGVIAAAALDYGCGLIKEGVKLLDVAEQIDVFVRAQGGRLAFPVGVSVNDMAAHYTPLPEDATVFAAGDVVKLDVGVHIDGFIADNARTVEVASDNHADLIAASLACLQAASKVVGPGIPVCVVGGAIADAANDCGFTSVRNLSGHGLGRWQVHSGVTIPNYDNGDQTELQVGQAVAIEPFVTEGSGFVKEGAHSTIYRFNQKGAVRDMTARKVLQYVLEEFRTLPFSRRAVAKEFGVAKATRSLLLLQKAGVVHGYSQLPDRDGKLVSQHENSFFLTVKGAVCTTPFR